MRPAAQIRPVSLMGKGSLEQIGRASNNKPGGKTNLGLEFLQTLKKSNVDDGKAAIRTPTETLGK